MQTPVEIAFRHCEATDEMRAEIATQLRRLDRFGDRITSCNVVVTGPGKRHRTGSPFHVELLINMTPHKNIAVSKHEAPEREHPLVAIREAFSEAIRQLEEANRETRAH